MDTLTPLMGFSIIFIPRVLIIIFCKVKSFLWLDVTIVLYLHLLLMREIADSLGPKILILPILLFFSLPVIYYVARSLQKKMSLSRNKENEFQ